METPAHSDTTHDESEQSKLNIEQPIPTDSPVISSAKRESVTPKAAMPRQSTVAKAIVEKNLTGALFELETEDLDLLECRVAELERYLGIEDMDLDYFVQNQGEDLNKKAQVLEDFMRAAEDRYFCINELFAKFEKMDTFLKHKQPFIDQCMDLKQKTNFITDWLDELQEFISQLEDVK